MSGQKVMTDGAVWELTTGGSTIANIDSGLIDGTAYPTVGANYYTYPWWYPNDCCKSKDSEIDDLKMKLRMLEQKSGMKVVENPRFKVVKSGKAKE